MSHIDSNCDYILYTVFMYKLKEDANFTKVHLPVSQHRITFVPRRKGVYDLMLEIQNNDGHLSQSDMVTIKVDS